MIESKQEVDKADVFLSDKAKVEKRTENGLKMELPLLKL